MCAARQIAKEMAGYILGGFRLWVFLLSCRMEYFYCLRKDLDSGV
jgi:hypothetical protein